jgi:ribosome assembly protein 1
VNGASVRDLVTFTVRAAPLPQPLFEFLLDNASVLKSIQHDRADQGQSLVQVDEAGAADAQEGLETLADAFRSATVRPENFWTTFEDKCKEVGGEWADIANQVWAFGPQRTGSCLLIDATSSASTTSYVGTPWSGPANANGRYCSLRRRLAKLRSTGDENIEEDQLSHDFHSYIETGFELATFQGPLCAEPVAGMAYFVQALQVDKDGLEEERRKPYYDRVWHTLISPSGQNRMAQVTGSFISAMKDACRNGLLDWSPRLMLAMYTCDIQASSQWQEMLPP